MDSKYLEEIEKRLSIAEIEDDWGSVNSELVYQDIPALVAEVERLNEFCDKWCRGEDQFQETVCQLDCANSEVERLTAENTALQNANEKLATQSRRIINREMGRDQQIATLKKALELESQSIIDAMHKLQDLGIFSYVEDSPVSEFMNHYIQQAQEQETQQTHETQEEK